MYAVFAGADYYAAGGWEDFVALRSTLEDAREAVPPSERCDWWHIVNLRTAKIEAAGYYDYHGVCHGDS